MIPNRQEGGAAFMAAAWGKLTGKPGVCFVTRGPGATNAAIGVHSARQDSSPMMLFVGQIATGMREREAFQEVDYRAAFGPLAKWATEIESPDRVAEIVARAFASALSGRPGPVVVALPEDVLPAPTAVAPGRRSGCRGAAPAPEDVDRVDGAPRRGRAAAARRRRRRLGRGRARRAPRLRRGEPDSGVCDFRCQDLLDNASPPTPATPGSARRRTSGRCSRRPT